MSKEQATEHQFLRSGMNLLTIWPAGLATDQEHTADAYRLIDPDSVSSAVGILRRFNEIKEATSADPALSDVGKLQRLDEAANNALGNLRTKADGIRRLESEYQEMAQEAVKIPEPGMADVMHDMEIARMARADSKTATAIELASERTRLALVRVPVEISGIKPETRERLRGSFISPELALELEQRSTALHAAREGVQRAIRLVSGHSSLGQAQKKAMVGEGFDV